MCYECEDATTAEECDRRQKRETCRSLEETCMKAHYKTPVEEQKSSEAAAKSQRVRILGGSAKEERKSNRMTVTLIR